MENSTLKEGDLISERYKVRYEIARTELSAIYVADDIRLSRQVALKHIFKTLDSKNDLTSLMQEAQLLSTMSHPNVLTVFDCIRDDQGAYIISEYLRGDNLEEYSKKNKLTIDDFVSFAEQMLMGLSEAHKQGIIHGDIKPNNVMVLQRPSGRKQLKLLDFGLSRMSHDIDSEEAKGQPIAGSAYFMSPEEFNGDPKSVASDLYSLGCVCYYMLTNHYPFDGDNTIQIMALHIQHKLHEPTHYRPDFPHYMNQWLMWMLNLKVENRPADASSALKVLTDCNENFRLSTASIQLASGAANHITNGNTNEVRLKAISPEAEEWAKVRNLALRSFSKLVSKQQAAAFMVQILETHGFAKNDAVPQNLRRLVITDYYALVPNKNKREMMMKEITALL